MRRSLTSLPLLKVVVPREDAAAEEGRVVELFRNRAELKKAYSALQQELRRLTDRLKQQEGATARVQDLLESLESRLAAPETAYPAVVFYQLRGLWQTGRRIIEQMATDLARQQEERERKLHVAETNRRQFVRRQELEARLREAETQAAAARGKAAALAGRRAALTRFWHYFERRRVEYALAAASAAATAADGLLVEARASFEALADERAAEFPGLSVEARRGVNLAAIACAEVLCLRLAGTPLVALAKAAIASREATDDYGERAECEQLMAGIAAARVALEQRAELGRELRERSERLCAIARYRDAGDTVPASDSLAVAGGDVPAGAVGSTAARLPNVLAEDTWGLFRVLLP